MAFTVTATQGGTVLSTGAALQVEVLTGASANQAAGASATSAAAYAVAITTTTTGSVVYGAVAGSTASLTANGSTTIIAQAAQGGVQYGAVRATAVTGTPGAVTVGATNTYSNGGVSLFEILPNGTITLDGSSPAFASANGSSATTASFAPPPGSLLVALVTTASTLVTITDTSGLGLTWTQRSFIGTDGVSGVYTAQMPPGGNALPQPAGQAYRRRFRRLQQLPPPPPSAPAFTTTSGITAGGTASTADRKNATDASAISAGGALATSDAKNAADASGITAGGRLQATPSLALTTTSGITGGGRLQAVPFSAAPAVTATWSGGNAVSSGYYFPYPQGRPVQITVANTAGDWMFAIITWRQFQGGAGVTVSVADDVHNFWEPLGAPSGDSSAAGVTRTAIWYAPAARAASYVQVAPTGFVLALAADIIDVSGMSKWYSLTAITPGYANTATSLSLGIGAPASQALMLAGLGTDNLSDTITGPGAGWTALTTVTESNGTDHTADLQLNAAYRLAATAETAAWSSSGSLDLSGVTAGVLVTAAGPTQPNPNWPVVITEIAPGAGVGTPPSQITWSALSARQLAMTFQQGRQYTLGQLQAGQGTMTIDNPDGALIPPGTGAFAGIDSGTPVRQRMILPSLASPYFVPFSGYFQRWPFNLQPDMLRGQTQATILDAWAYAGGTLDSMTREENLLDNPYAYWPCGDVAGSAQASNLAPGNSNPLAVVTSKLGGGGSAQAFGANSGYLIGDSSAKITASGQAGGGTGVWSQTLGGVAATTNGYGYALACTDANYPSVTNGVTIEGWFGFTAAPNAAWEPVMWSARNLKGPVIELDVNQANGNLVLRYGNGAGASTTIVINSGNDWRGLTSMTHVSVAFNQTTYQVIVDGGAFSGISGTFGAPLPAQFTIFTVGGIFTSGVTGYQWSGYSAHYAIYPAFLSPIRALSHFYAAKFGMAGEEAPDRIERILEYASLTGRRCLLQEAGIPYEGDTCVSGQDIGGQPAATSVTNISASTVPAMMYVAPTGDLFYRAKYYSGNQPVTWTLGDNTAGGEIPYLPSFATDYDPSRVVNDIQLTQLDTSTVTIPAGNAVAALEAASQLQYGDQPYQVTGYLQDDASASYTAGAGLNDLASWLAYTYSKPRNRIQSVTVDAARHPSAWNFVAGVSVGDMVTVNLRPPTAATSPLVSVTARVTQTTRAVQFDQETVVGSVTCVLDYAAEENVLICDDAVRGLLNGSNVLGW